MIGVNIQSSTQQMAGWPRKIAPTHEILLAYNTFSKKVFPLFTTFGVYYLD